MLVSHGRGGAGNYAASTKYDKITPKDLQTPTLKGSVVTTGRGGSGNMLVNDDPAETRMRQDVDGVARRSSSSVTHYGRGGAANVFRMSPEDAAAANKASFESAVIDDESSGYGRRSSEIAAKGKAWLQNLAGKKA